MKRMILFYALCACLVLSCARRPGDGTLQTGDLIFVGIPTDYSLDETSMDAAITAATGAADSLNLIHVAIAEIDAEGKAWIIDATIRHGVDRHPLDTFLADFTLKDGSYPVFEIKRIRDARLAEAAVARARQFVGLPYDVHFLPDNGALYCTELVQAAYLDGDGSGIFPSAPMNFKGADGEFPLYWTQLFGLLGEPIPQDIPGTNPQAMARDPHLRPVDVSLP
ncbi:MAG: hypothetical protein IJ654_06495 [Bacteroidales bacterium]|nr:hypothetical protein [Bacteroidales bacterium]